MELHELLKVVGTKETDSQIEVVINCEDGTQHVMDDYSYIMSIGFTIYNDAIVTSVTAIDDTLCITAEVKAVED